jgi:hypothetical protein
MQVQCGHVHGRCRWQLCCQSLPVRGLGLMNQLPATATTTDLTGRPLLSVTAPARIPYLEQNPCCCLFVMHMEAPLPTLSPPSLDSSLSQLRPHLPGPHSTSPLDATGPTPCAPLLCSPMLSNALQCVRKSEIRCICHQPMGRRDAVSDPTDHDRWL